MDNKYEETTMDYMEFAQSLIRNVEAKNITYALESLIVKSEEELTIIAYNRGYKIDYAEEYGNGDDYVDLYAAGYYVKKMPDPLLVEDLGKTVAGPSEDKKTALLVACGGAYKELI